MGFTFELFSLTGAFLSLAVIVGGAIATSPKATSSEKKKVLLIIKELDRLTCNLVFFFSVCTRSTETLHILFPMSDNCF